MINKWFYGTFMVLVLTLASCGPSMNQAINQPLLRYNYMEKEWSYATTEEQLRYNYLENRYEFSK